MQDLYVMYDETLSLVDFDDGQSKTIRIPLELAGVVKEEIIMLMNEETISGAAATINAYVMNVLFPDDPVEGQQNLGTQKLIETGEDILNAGGVLVDIRAFPDNVDMDMIVMGLDAEDYAISHRKGYRKYKAGDDIILELHATTVTELGTETEFNGAGDSVRITYIGKYGVFC